MKNTPHIDEKLRQLLEGLEREPRLTSFDAVIRKMQKKKRRRFVIFFLSGLTFLSAVIFLWTGQAADIHFLSGNKSRHQRNSHQKHLPINTVAPEHEERAGQTSVTPVMRSAPAAGSGQRSRTLRESQKTPVSIAEVQPSSSRGQFSLQPGEKKALERTLSSERSFSTTAVSSTGSVSIEENPVSPDIDPTAGEPSVFLQPPAVPQPPQLPDTLWKATSSGSCTTTKEKSISFYLGFQYTAQLSSILYIENSDRNPAYMNAADYLRQRKNTNPFNYTSSYSIKAGLVLNDRCEFFLSAGLQNYKESEKNYYGPPTLSNLNNSTGGSYNQINNAGTDQNKISQYVYHYIYGAAEVNRLFQWNKRAKLKVGAGFQFNHTAPWQETSRQVSASGLSPWLYTASVKTGWVTMLTKRLRFQLCPGVFYVTNSLFSKTYIIKERPYGFQLEAALLFKLF